MIIFDNTPESIERFPKTNGGSTGKLDPRFDVSNSKWDTFRILGSDIRLFDIVSDDLIQTNAELNLNDNVNLEIIAELVNRLAQENMFILASKVYNAWLNTGGFKDESNAVHGAILNLPYKIGAQITIPFTGKSLPVVSNRKGFFIGGTIFYLGEYATYNPITQRIDGDENNHEYNVRLSDGAEYSLVLTRIDAAHVRISVPEVSFEQTIVLDNCKLYLSKPENYPNLIEGQDNTLENSGELITGTTDLLDKYFPFFKSNGYFQSTTIRDTALFEDLSANMYASDLIANEIAAKLCEREGLTHLGHTQSYMVKNATEVHFIFYSDIYDEHLTIKPEN